MRAAKAFEILGHSVLVHCLEPRNTLANCGTGLDILIDRRNGPEAWSIVGRAEREQERQQKDQSPHFFSVAIGPNPPG